MVYLGLRPCCGGVPEVLWAVCPFLVCRLMRFAEVDKGKVRAVTVPVPCLFPEVMPP